MQYRPTSEGDYVQSQEDAIIDSDMQPSSQVAEKEEQGKIIQYNQIHPT